MVLQKAIRTFWDAVEAKDKEGINDAYVRDEGTYVVLEGPRYTTLGFNMISKGWSDFCDSPINLESIKWVEGPFEELDVNMGWIGGIIDIAISASGKEFVTRFRCSFVMTKGQEEDDEIWRIRHEHVSAPLPDPYGVGDWLKA